MKPPKSRKDRLGSTAMGREVSPAEAKCARAEGVGLPECEARAAKRSQEAASAEFKMTELGPIPVDWEVKRLGEIGEPLMCKRTLKSQTFDVGDVPFYKIGTFGGIADAYISRSLYESFRRKYPYPKTGDVLVSAAGTIGRTVVYDGKDAYFQDSNIVWVDNDEKRVLNDYLYWWYKVIIWNTEDGGIVTRLYNSNLKASLIAVPPLAEQQAIATVLSDVDELISALGKLIEKKRNIKTGAMQQLLTGKTRLPGFKGKWVEKTFCEFILRFATGLNPRQNFKLNSGGNNYYITIKDFKDGKLSFNDCDMVDDLALKLINERSDLRAGDLLFSSIGRVGDAYVIKETPSNWNVNESVFSLRPDSRQMDVNFLYYLVKGNAVQERLTSGITGSTLTGIKIGELRGIVCFYPGDVAEQKAIAAVLSDIDEEIAALEADRAKYERIKSGMMQELLTGKTRLKGE